MNNFSHLLEIENEWYLALPLGWVNSKWHWLVESGCPYGSGTEGDFKLIARPRDKAVESMYNCDPGPHWYPKLNRRAVISSSPSNSYRGGTITIWRYDNWGEFGEEEEYMRTYIYNELTNATKARLNKFWRAALMYDITDADQDYDGISAYAEFNIWEAI